MKKIPTSDEEALDRYDMLCKYFDGEATVSEIARLTGVSSRTIWRQINSYREKGVKGLKRQGREDKGKSRKLTNRNREIIEGLYLRNPKPTVVWVHEQLTSICERDKIPQPSYWLVWNICQQIDARLKMLAHEGEEAYEQAYEIVIRRNANHPNEMWQSDHTETKVWSVDEKGRVAKVWITAILDDYSRAVPGYFLGVGAPNSMRIASALRQAIWEKSDKDWQICGIPEILYTDRGTDFKSNHIRQAAADLGIRLVKTKRNKPRGKGKIERFFRTVKQRFFSKIKSSRNKPCSLKKLTAKFHEWLLKDYNNKRHSVIKETPLSKWNNPKIIPRLPNSVEDLDLMLQKVAKPRKMWRDGIRFNNFIYSSDLLTEMTGVEFSIRYDPRDIASIWVYAEEGKLFCRATCEELTGESRSAEEIIKQRNRIKKELKAKIRDSRKKANSAIVKEREPSEEKDQTKTEERPVRRLKKHFHERN